MDLLILHGAIGSAKQFDSLAKKLGETFTVYTLDFSGHGGKPLPVHFSTAGFAREVLSWMDSKNIARINIFGYSMGGYVGLYLARHHPEKVEKLFTLATKLNWNAEIS